MEIDYFDLYPLGYAVEEMKTDVLLAPAKFERPTTINMTLKGGSNHLHGIVQATLTQQCFVALANPRDHTDNCTSDRPCTGAWNGELQVNGPVYIPNVYDGRDRTFWMFTYTPQKNTTSVSPYMFLIPPTLTGCTGNMSSVTTPLINPFTGGRLPGIRLVRSIRHCQVARLPPQYPPALAERITADSANTRPTTCGRL